jgi:hypothetical protein
MKSIYKRVLVIGLSLSLIALAGLQSANEQQIEGDIDDEGQEDNDKILGPIPVPDLEPGPRTLAFSRPAPPVETLTAATKVTFSGKIVRNGPYFALQEMAGALYTLGSIGHPLPTVGQDVRVTGKLDLTHGLLHVDEIEPFLDAQRFYPRAAS